MRPHPHRLVLATLLLLAAPLAGCLGSDTPGSSSNTSDAPVRPAEPLYPSFDAAMDAANQAFAPDTDASLRLALIDPANPANVSVAKQNVTFVLYDEADRRPVEEANVTLDAIMVAMGHGTSPEEDPIHRGHGVYQGLTNVMMEGSWTLELEATMADGSTVAWSIELKAGGVGGGEPNTQPVHHRFEETFQETVTGVEHATAWPFPVNATGASIHLNASLAEPKATDELTLALLDANGTELVSKTLTADAAVANLTAASAPNVGDYTVNVTGRALDTTYTVDVTVVWVTMEPVQGSAQASSGDGDGHGGHHHA